MKELNLPKLIATMLVAVSGVLTVGETFAIEPETDRILRAMGDYLKSAEEFSFHADITYDAVLSTGEKVKYGGVSDILVRRPNRLLVATDGDEFRRKVFYDGSSIILLDVLARANFERKAIEVEGLEG